MSELEFPPIEPDAIVGSDLTPAITAPAGLDLSKVNLTDVALAQFGNWRDKTADARKTLTGVQHDLSTQVKIDDAKSLRHRLINIPLADARKVSKALKSKLNAVSSEVGAELTAIESEFAGVALLITPQIEARESQLAKEKAEREEAEAARKKVHTDAIAKIAGYVGQAADLSAERIATGITFLQGLDLSGFEEFTSEATTTRDRSVAALQVLHVKAVAREAEEARLEAERVEQARVAAEQAETARKLKAQQDEIAQQRAELDARRAEEEERARATARREQEAREAEERQQREAAEEAERLENRPALLERAREIVGDIEAAEVLREAVTAPAASTAEASTERPNVHPIPTRAPAVVAGPPTLKLGEIQKAIAPLSITAEGLALLGFPHAGNQGVAKLYRLADFPRMREAIGAHALAAELQQQAA